MTGGGSAGELGPVPGIWEPPPEDERQDDQVYDTPVGDADDVLRVRQTYDLHDNLVDFAIMLITGAPELESEVARADIRHTGLHVHWFYRDGEELRREEIRPVTKLAEVQGAYIDAFDRLTERCAEYKRRWLRG